MADLFSALATHLAGHYTLERQLGEGGMATVFLAQDVKHRRQVAIKVLKPELAETIGTERFLREIQLAAGLQHPHIVPVYDSGAAGKHLYYVMPFVEGESLRDRLQRERRIPLDEALQLTRESASALAYAHQHGIVHRDIKPENILLSGGHAVVTDFGIARAATRPVADARLTGLGMAIGTPAYMSPEQATGSETVDARADEYALGCVFYEMATGEQPFTGPNIQAVITRHITGPRPKMSRSGEQVAPGPIASRLDAVLARALAADPAERYDSVTSFSAALDAAAISGRHGLPTWVWGAAAALVVIAAAGGWLLAPGRSVVKGAERIAVLPFSISGGDPLFGEGMVDLLSTNLATVSGMETADPRAVLMQVRKRGGNAGLDLEGALEVGRTLDAGAVLMGSAVTVGDQVRLSATLYGADGSPLGQAQVNGLSAEMLPLVDSLSAALVREIWKSREPVPSLNVAGLTTSSLPALRAYLEGTQFYRRGEWDSAIAYFTRATEADSTFALAHYRLAMAWGWRGNSSGNLATKASRSALQFSDRLPPRERTLVRAYRLFQQFLPEAADTMRAFLALHPNDPDAWYLLGESQYHTRDMLPRPPQELLEPFDKVLALDPSLTPALIHPMEIALQQNDSTLYRHYLELGRASAGAAEQRTFDILDRIAFDPAAPDSLVRTILTPNTGLLMAAVSGAYHDPTTTAANVADRATRIYDNARPGMFGNEVEFLRAGARLSLGQLAKVNEIGRAAIERDRQTGMFIQIMPALFGMAPPEQLEQIKTQMAGNAERETSPFPRSLAITVALQAGDLTLARRLLAPVVRDSTTLAPGFRFLWPLFLAQSGWADVLAGDTTAGARKMHDGLIDMLGMMGPAYKDPIRFQYALTLAQRTQTQAQGIRFLEDGFDEFWAYLPASKFALGQVYELTGEKEKAIDAYSHFLRLWADADSSLQGRAGQARDALARLTAEPARR